MIMRGRFILLIALGLALPAVAADAPPPPPIKPVQAVPPPPPPPQSAGDAETAPQVTIVHRGQTKIEEYRIHGRLYMIKVTPRYGKPYYLVPRPNGSIMRFNDLAPDFVAPMWIIKEF